MLAAVPVVCYGWLLHPVVFGKAYEFSPLLVVSVYAAVGVVGSWLGFLVVFFSGGS